MIVLDSGVVMPLPEICRAQRLPYKVLSSDLPDLSYRSRTELSNALCFKYGFSSNRLYVMSVKPFVDATFAHPSVRYGDNIECVGLFIGSHRHLMVQIRVFVPTHSPVDWTNF